MTIQTPNGFNLDDSGRRVVVDPITRIEGHLRIDVEVENGSVQNSWSSGQMWRGIEVILKGTDPRDAWMFTQRICGVCTTVHAITSVRAVENALQLEVRRDLFLDEADYRLHRGVGPLGAALAVTVHK
mgnify:CR=1 FL=1